MNGHFVLALAVGWADFEAGRPLVPLMEATPNDRHRAVFSFRLKNHRDDPVAWFTRRQAERKELAQSMILRRNRLGVVDIAVDVPAGRTAAVAYLSATGVCEFVESAAPVSWLGLPNDPGFASQWHLYNTGQSGGARGADVAAPWAFEIEDGDPSIVIATIDSGVDLHHPDLAANLCVNSRELAGNGRDDDGNGYVDDVCGFDFGDLDPDVTPCDAHGTAVAGVIAATGNNGLGVTGLAGGGRDGVGCRLLPIRIGGSNATNDSLDDAILYAIDQGARVIVLALATQPARSVELALEAADTAGVLVIGSAGNGGEVTYPARHPLVVAVGGSDAFDRGGRFSAGPEIDLAAPATDILTTIAGGGYATLTGTSFAAPQVAALAGLILSHSPALAPAQVRAILERTARSAGDAAYVGRGRIDAWAALLATRSAIPPNVIATGDVALGAPAIGSNGEPPLVGSTRFGIFGAGFAPGALVWLVITNTAPTADAQPVVIPALADEFGEVEAPVDLPAHDGIAGRRIFAQWFATPSGAALATSSRVLAITIGS